MHVRGGCGRGQRDGEAQPESDGANGGRALQQLGDRLHEGLLLVRFSFNPASPRQGRAGLAMITNVRSLWAAGAMIAHRRAVFF